MVLPQAVLQQVIKRFGVLEEELLSTQRNLRVTFARHAAMYLCRKVYGYSYPELARAFNMINHTSAMYAVARITNDACGDIQFAEWLATTIADLQQLKAFRPRIVQNLERIVFD